MFRTTINRLSLVAMLAALICSQSPAIAQEPPRHPVVSKYLVGNNTWMNPGQREWDFAKECGLQCVRQGGEAYDNNTGPIDEWTKKTVDIGAMPNIQIPQSYSGEKAAELVKKFPDVLYWSIGNEPGLHGDQVGTISALIKRCAPAMKAANPKIKILVANECDLWYGGGYYRNLFSTTGGEYDVSGKTPDGKYWMVDGISWHRYANGDITNDVGSRVKEAWEHAQKVSEAKKRTGDDVLTCGIGEFNHNGGGGTCTFVNGQAFACIYGLCMKYEYAYACTWSMFENGGSCGGTDFSWLFGDGKPKSTFYHMKMVAKNMSGIYCEGKTNQASVVAYGTRDENKLCAMIVNKGGSSQSYTLSFNTAPVAGACQINIDAETDCVYKDVVPANATHCIVIKKTGSAKTEYTSGHFNARQPSVTSAITETWTGSILPTSAVLERDRRLSAQKEISIRQRQGGITLHLPVNQQYQVELLTLNGAVLKTEMVQGQEVFCSTQGLAPGMYVVRANGASGTYVNRVVIGR
jgi:hypothetical protein